MQDFTQQALCSISGHVPNPAKRRKGSRAEVQSTQRSAKNYNVHSCFFFLIASSHCFLKVSVMMLVRVRAGVGG